MCSASLGNFPRETEQRFGAAASHCVRVHKIQGREAKLTGMQEKLHLRAFVSCGWRAQAEHMFLCRIQIAACTLQVAWELRVRASREDAFSARALTLTTLEVASLSSAPLINATVSD